MNPRTACDLVFYEKPGCASNAKQKSLLRSLGHRLEVRDLLTEPWTEERLRGFFDGHPVTEWFNPSAPRIKNGQVRPERLDASRALALMLADPLLIRRPLIEVGPERDRERCCGFDAGPVLRRLGIDLAPGDDLQSCSRPAPRDPCPSPGG